MVVERVVTCDGCLEPLDDYAAHWALDIFTDPTDEDEDDPEANDDEPMYLFHGFDCFAQWRGRQLTDEIETWRLSDG